MGDEVRWFGVLGVSCGLLALACGGDDGDEPGGVTIGWLAKGADNTFFDLARAAADLAAADLSSASGREVTVVHLDTPESAPPPSCRSSAWTPPSRWAWMRSMSRC